MRPVVIVRSGIAVRTSIVIVLRVTLAAMTLAAGNSTRAESDSWQQELQGDQHRYYCCSKHRRSTGRTTSIICTCASEKCQRV